ncbi:SDR family oxidoreductase [Streptomyces sp. Ru72]|uniref:SDR family oxidoreductase n=1 Tax=Streptomyces sp. Ru72 TaxID=2080747 RepID=UPI001C6734DD|nr:SDR family oxidoreductase [Streptomyces sp. Ru72]
MGGTSGMGLAIARHVLDAAGSVVVTGRTPSGAEDATAALADSGRVTALAADLNDADAVERLRADLAKDHADAALLVNAAGVFAPKPFVDHPYADYDRYQALNGPSPSSPRPSPAT